VPIHHDLLGAQLTSTERIFRPIANVAHGAKSCSAFENVVVAGATVPMHRHAVEEIIVCLSGTAECSFEDGKPEAYAAGSVVIIPAGKLHTLRNTGPTELRQLSFFAGPDPDTHWVEPAGSVVD
jgi:quercetin dioxygenase-like cupin family protein